MGKKILIFLAACAIPFTAWNYFRAPAELRLAADLAPEEISAAEVLPEAVPDPLRLIEINDGHTYGALMREAGIDHSLSQAIYQAALPVYDLAKIRSGRQIGLLRDDEGFELIELRYKIDTENELRVRRAPVPRPDDENETVKGENGWSAEIAPITYHVISKTASGRVESSMYQAALDNDIDIRAIIELADAFQWTIDFAMDPRQGDTFKMVYEERYLDGKYVMPGRIFAGQYVNDGTKHEVYYFRESDDNAGFFDAEGNSVQKMFLKAPVAYKYISSGFTTGLRYIQAFNISTGHRAIDYAAPAGTPIRAVGDGTVTFAGWNGSYGYMTSIRHNGTYSTNYAHQSRIAVRVGQKVKQGQVIGYVGSTGLSTGPHLHYEMVKNGVKVNPLREVLPPGEPIKEENKERFFEAIRPFKEMLNNTN